MEGDPRRCGRTCPGLARRYAAAGAFPCDASGLRGPNWWAMILFESLAQTRATETGQSERYAREGIDLEVSTLADEVGARTSVCSRSVS